MAVASAAHTTRLVLGLALAGPFSCCAEHLPFRHFTQTDGLPGVAVHRIVRDSIGYLWFCTNEGLTRYDGFAFTNYGVAQGLSDPNVHVVVESGDGAYWAGTADGLYRLNERGRLTPVFRPQGDSGASWINTASVDAKGAIWIGTRHGLYHFVPGNNSATRVELPESTSQTAVTDILQDPQAGMWVATTSGLYLAGSGGIVRYSIADGLPTNFVVALGRDAEGNLWAGTQRGLCRIADNRTRGRIVQRTYTVADGLPDDNVRTVLQHSDGSFWIGSQNGFARLVRPDGGGQETFEIYGHAQGLVDSDIQSMAEDRNGNLWIGTNFGAAVRLERGALVKYDQRDGLGTLRVVGMAEDNRGRAVVISREPGRLFANWFDGTRFHAERIPAPEPFYSSKWLGWRQVLLQSRTGEWWCASEAGLLRLSATDIAGLSRASFQRFGISNGLGGTHIYQIFEDSTGRLWIATRDPDKTGVTVRDPRTGEFHELTERDGFPAFRDRDTWANGFFEDRAGQVWIGLHRSGAIRFAHGKFSTFSIKDGLPAGGIRCFWQDREGRLWLGSGHGGAARTDRPDLENPHFVVYDRTKGLSGDEIQAIIEDRLGRIYLASGSVVDRLDPATGRIRHYSTAEGLADGEVQASYRDPAGNLWFGTVGGVSRMSPAPDGRQEPPPIRISRAAIGGVRHPVAEMGATQLVLPDMAARQNVELAYLGLSFVPGDVLRFQYRLEGLQAEWSQATEQRSVTYAGVAPGKYRFSVRAIDSAGMVSAIPAVAQFEVLPPIWMRWWFLSACGLMAGLTILGSHRYRVRQALMVERMRSRLTSDFHDEIGSGLARITVLSELAGSRLSHPEEAAEPIARVGEITRELLDSLEELLWALDPRLDRLEDLANRMRTFANEMLEGQSIELEFQTEPSLDSRQIDFEKRREIYLIFREAIHNIVRHADCNRVTVDLSLQGDRFIMVIADNGKGIEAAAAPDSRGIRNMRSRAQALGGQIVWSAGPGTIVTLDVPLRR